MNVKYDANFLIKNGIIYLSAECYFPLIFPSYYIKVRNQMFCISLIDIYLLNSLALEYIIPIIFSLALCKTKNNANRVMENEKSESEFSKDKLEAIFEAQRQLSLCLVGSDFSDLDDQSKVHWILNYSRAMQQEIAELIDSVPWKWWAKYQDFDQQNARVEVIDLFHFLVATAQVLGMNADDLYKAYTAKNKVNHKRQEEGGYQTKNAEDSRHI